MTLWTSTGTNSKSLFHHILIFLTTVYLLSRYFHPETSFLVNLPFYNGDNEGTLAFHKSCLGLLSCQCYYTYGNSTYYVHYQTKKLISLLKYSRKIPKHYFQGGVRVSNANLRSPRVAEFFFGLDYDFFPDRKKKDFFVFLSPFSFSSVWLFSWFCIQSKKSNHNF